jgi:hypothetical protein
MTNLINIEVLDNNQGGHEDLLFDIAGLVSQKRFDTYYFALAIEPKNRLAEIKKAVGLLVESWNRKIKGLENGKTIYLPIDFSDQYTGCIKLEKDDNINLTYGYSMKEGWSIDPINPTDYFDSIIDFKPEGNESLKVEQGELETCLTKLIDKLKKE